MTYNHTEYMRKRRAAIYAARPVPLINVRNTKHRMSWSREFRSWVMMRQRCRNPKANNYKHYGAKGVTICQRWDEFAVFLADMGPRPKDTTLGRVDNSKGYEPGNCRWETHVEQCRNRSITRVVQYNGTSRPVAEVAALHGLTPKKLARRLASGYSLDESLAAGNMHMKVYQLIVRRV